MRDSLARHIVRDPATAEELFRLRQRAWVEQGVAVLPVSEITDDWGRQVVAILADELYGKRRGKAA